MHAHAGVCVLVCVRACMKMLFFSLEHSPTAYLKFFYKAIPDDQVLILVTCQLCDFKTRFLTALKQE